MWNCKGEASNQSGYHNGGDALWVRSQETPLKGSGRKIIALATAEGNGLRNVLCHYSWLFQNKLRHNDDSYVVSFILREAFSPSMQQTSWAAMRSPRGILWLSVICGLKTIYIYNIYNITICYITYIYIIIYVIHKNVVNMREMRKKWSWLRTSFCPSIELLLQLCDTRGPNGRLMRMANLFKASPVLHKMNLKVSTSNPLRGKFELQREQRVKRWNIEVWWSACLAIPPTRAHSDILLSGDTMPIRARLHSCCLVRIDWLRVVTWSQPKRSSSPAGTCFRHRL